MNNLLLRTTCIVIALLCVNILSAQDLWDRHTVASSFHDGEGTEANPYQIRTGAELMYFVNMVNAGNDFNGKTVKLMNDIDLNNDNFSISKPFAGTFNGGGHFLTMMVGVSSNNEPFTNVSGCIHHLGFVISMKSEYKGVYYGQISVVGTLNESGILEDIHYMVNESASIFYYQPALAYRNYGTIRNCYAGGSFWTYGGYYETDGSLLVRDNYETGVIENCYAYVNRGMTNVGNRALPLAYTDEGTIIHNSTNIEELNKWVDEHPGHSRWTDTDIYKLVDFNPSTECIVEFVDTMFSTSTPTLSVMRGQAIGELPIPDVDCTFAGWVRSGKIVKESDIVNANWTLYAKWEQRIKRQPTAENMEVFVDDMAHASFQWFSNSGEKQYFEDVLLKCSSDDYYADTIDILAKAGQTIHFDYVVSSEKDYDQFTASIDGQTLVVASGERHGNITYVFPTDGTFKLILRYSKDEGTSDGLDMANVTNIMLSEVDEEIECTSNRLPVNLVEKESNYFCKISYSNTGIVLYTDTIHCIPNYSPKISFADANVKALCVSNWDMNGDEELSEEEAAAVTDLGTVFKNNTQIKSFGELQYFTGITSIGDNAFYKCSGLTSVTIPNSVTSIGSAAFYGCSGLTSITIPNSVTSIGEDAFAGCSGLISVVVEDGNTKYDSRDNCNAIIETATNTLITGCKNTIIPNSVTIIGRFAFEGCKGLTSVTIPNSVTSIGYHAFDRCSGLTSVTIGNSVTTIGGGAFYGCSGLTEVYCYAENVPNTNRYEFEGVNLNNTTLYVPGASVEKYQSTEPWSGFGNIVKIDEGDDTSEDTDISQLDNVIYVKSLEGHSDSQIELPIQMKNSAAIRGFQFDIYLPEGVTVVKSAKGKILASLTESRLPEDDGHTLTLSEQGDGSIRFLCGSLYDETFTGNDGEIATLTVKIDENMSDGNYPIILRNIKLTETDISKYYETPLVRSTLSVVSYMLGDINGDGKVDVSDYIGIANHILGNTPEGFVLKAADVNEDGLIDVSDYIGVANIILTGSIYGGNSNARMIYFQEERNQEVDPE